MALFLRGIESNGHLSLTASSKIMWDYQSVICGEINKVGGPTTEIGPE